MLLPGQTLQQAMTVVQSLRDVMPAGQTFSAGIAAWDPSTEPGFAVARADEAMYVAKRNGRDRVVIHPGGDAGPVDESGLPPFHIVLQPLVDVLDGRVIGHEALCRFPESAVDPSDGVQGGPRERVGRPARGGRHPPGDGAARASAAHRAVRQRLGRRARLPSVLGASACRPARGRGASSTREAGPLDDDELGVLVDRLRARGARIALDDLGAGASELIRLAGLRPDVIKIDRGLVHGCADDTGRCAVISALVAYADILDVLVCAEGLERRRGPRAAARPGHRLRPGLPDRGPSPDWHTAVVPSWTELDVNRS